MVCGKKPLQVFFPLIGVGEKLWMERAGSEKRNHIDLHKYVRIILYIIIIRQGLEPRSQLTGLNTSYSVLWFGPA